MTQVISSQIQSTLIPHDIMEVYNELSISTKNREYWQNVSEYRLWKELVFCILSANVPYELATSAVDVLNQKGMLKPFWLANMKKSENVLAKELSKPIFKPIRIDGLGRKYRYPNTRARSIVGASKIIYNDNRSIKNILKNTESDVDTRNHLAKLVPGLGLKEASHFLRNVGFSNSLAVIDVHMLDFMSEFLEINLRKRSISNVVDYTTMENILQNFCMYHGLNLAIFDLAVWFYMRDNYA